MASAAAEVKSRTSRNLTRPELLHCDPRPFLLPYAKREARNVQYNSSRPDPPALRAGLSRARRARAIESQFPPAKTPMHENARKCTVFTKREILPAHLNTSDHPKKPPRISSQNP